MYKVLLTLATIIRWSNAYKSGAPSSVCNIMIPSPLGHHGHGSGPRNSDPPYHIEILNASNKPVTEYSPGSKEALRIVIAGDRYRGFLLQARSLLGAGRRVGKFVEPLPSGSQFLDCDGEDSHSAVTHDCGHMKQEMRFLWPTPRDDIGPVQFVATVVYNKSIFWTNVQSVPLYPRGAYLSTDTVNTSRCGRGFGCFRYGAKGCDKDNACNFTLVWKCLKRHILFEYMALKNANHLKHIGAYVGLAISDDNQLTENEVFVCQVHENKSRINTYFNYRDKPSMVAQTDSLELIKFDVTPDYFYCRFTRRLRSFEPKHYFFITGKVKPDGTLEKPAAKNTIPIEDDSLNICTHPNVIMAVTQNDALSNIRNNRLDVVKRLIIPFLLIIFYCG